MEVFYLTLSQMLTMFIYIVIGYLLRKTKVLSETSQLTMSRLETYLFVPALAFHSWMKNCNVNSLKENTILIFYGLILVLCAIILAHPLSKLFVRKVENAELNYQRNIYKYAMTFGNFGFMGNFIVLGIWGSEMFFKYSMFTLCISFACNSWGFLTLVPNENAKKQSIKDILMRFVTPQIVALIAGLIAGLCNLERYVPTFAMSVLSGAADCMGPVAMVLAGVVVGGYDLKELLTYKKVYAASFMRLLVIPACFVLALRFFGTSKEIITLALIAFATPLGLYTIVYPAAYGRDVKTGASMVVISHVLSVITIPLMYLLFVVLGQ